MSNVVQLFAPKKANSVERPPVDVTGLVVAIVDWAEAQGIDLHNNPAFEIRVSDLMAQLQIMARDSQLAA